jgi:hypothetical protein
VGTWGLSSGAKWLGYNTGPLYSAKVRTVWIFTSTPPCTFLLWYFGTETTLRAAADDDDTSNYCCNWRLIMIISKVFRWYPWQTLQHGTTKDCLSGHSAHYEEHVNIILKKLQMYFQ